jgi:hypothetical protein
LAQAAANAENATAKAEANAAVAHALIGNADLNRARADKVAAVVLTRDALRNESAALAKRHAATVAKAKALADLAAAANEAASSS